MEEHVDEPLAMKEVFGRKYAGFLIRGEDIRQAEEMLSGHGIAWERREDALFTPMPRERSRMAIIVSTIGSLLGGTATLACKVEVEKE